MSSRARLWLATYLSFLLHFVLAYIFFENRQSIYEKTLCGPPWIYADEPALQGEISLEFSSLGEEGDSPKKGEGGEEDGEEANGDFSKSKYEGGKWENLVKDLESVSKLRENYQNEFEDLFPNTQVSDSYIKRNREYEDIIIKEVFPTLRTIREPFHVDLEEAEDNLLQHKERNRIIEEFRKGRDLGNPITMKVDTQGERPPKEPLAMTREDRVHYLDKSIKKSKEKQLDEFIQKYMGYDTNKGDLSKFVRDLYYENLQRLAYTFSGDITYFTIDYFQENLNKEDYLRQMMALLSQNLGSKVGTEILFTLENIYEIQGRALDLYFQNSPLYKTYSPEKRKEIRIEAIKRVIEKYKPILQDKKILNADDANKAFALKRIEILDTLIRHTPDSYRAKDATFEKGRILWEQGDHREAVKLWSTIPRIRESGDFLNQKTAESILSIAKGQTDSLNPEVVERIDMAIRYRLTEFLEAKKIREDKLLWKRSSPP